MFADQPPAIDIEPIYGCGFNLYCGFDDWFMVKGGLLLLLVIGALVVKRWRDLPLVALVSLFGPMATSYMLGAQTQMLVRSFDLVIFFAIATAIAVIVQALKRLAVYAFRASAAPA